MRQRHWLLALSILTALSLAACGGGDGPVAVQSVQLARDDGSGEPGEIVTGFQSDDRIFHAVIELNRLEAGLKVDLAWIAVDAGGVQDYEIDRATFTALAANTIHGEIELPDGWPQGDYRLDVYLNDALARSVDFTVQ